MADASTRRNTQGCARPAPREGRRGPGERARAGSRQPGGGSAGSPRAAPQVWEVLGKAEVRSHWDPRGDAASVGRGLPGRPCHAQPWAGSSLCGLGLCANVVIEFRVWPLCPGTVALAAIRSRSCGARLPRSALPRTVSNAPGLA